MIKAKLYELLSVLFKIDDYDINMKIYNTKIINFFIIDYDKYQNNTNILILLNGTIKSMFQSKLNIPFANKLLLDLGLISFFANHLNHNDYKQPLASRKNIYPFIHNFTSFLISHCE
jgi:hypothetical protein